MKKQKVYLGPDGTGEVKKTEVINLTFFRSKKRITQFAEKIHIPELWSSCILSNKMFDNFSLDELQDLYNSEIRLKNLKHPVENYQVSLESIASLKELVEQKPNLKIGIYGDYDGDGITSTLILQNALAQIIPADRIFIDFSRVGEDGFGFSERGLKNLEGLGCEIIYVLDTGSNSEDVLRMGIESESIKNIIVVDHHPLLEENSKVEGVFYVNPHLPENKTPNPEELRNAGLTWFYARKLLESFNINTDSHYEYPLAISAIGTVADAGNQFEGIYNRRLLHEGLQPDKLKNIEGLELIFRAPENRFINNLSDDELARGFRIISLGKRTKSILPDIVYELLLPATTKKRREEIITILNETYEIFMDMAEKATEHIMESYDEKEDIVVAVAPSEIVPHEYIGLSGTLASKIRSRTKKPAIIFVRDEDDSLKGSWRTGDINGEELMRNANQQKENLIEQFGGHAPAGGVLLKSQKAFFSFAFIITETLRDIKTNKPRTFYNNPNVSKHFVTNIIDINELNQEFNDFIIGLTPFNRYDIKPLSFLLENQEISKNGSEIIIKSNSGDISCEISEEIDINELKEHQVVDLILVFDILSTKEVKPKISWLIDSEYALKE